MNKLFYYCLFAIGVGVCFSAHSCEISPAQKCETEEYVNTARVIFDDQNYEELYDFVTPCADLGDLFSLWYVIYYEIEYLLFSDIVFESHDRLYRESKIFSQLDFLVISGYEEALFLVESLFHITPIEESVFSDASRKEVIFRCLSGEIFKNSDDWGSKQYQNALTKYQSCKNQE